MNTTEQRIVFTNEVADALISLIDAIGGKGGVYIISDDNTTDAVVAPLLDESPELAGRVRAEIVIPPDDTNKNIDSLYRVWEVLGEEGATRSSLVINIGGGMVTDLGGFAAATFKRGVRFVNVATTLLGAVDAAVGGKTGINIGNLKNEAGVFAPADAVVISTRFFATLDRRQCLSGYAEMIKHGFLSDGATVAALLDRQPDDFTSDSFLALLRESVEVKRRIVAEDPTEKGLRKALNFGHTAGHAFETLAMEKEAPVAHGYAVAWGMLVELMLSHTEAAFPTRLIHHYARFVADHYGVIPFGCDDYPRLIALMSHDKKNATPDQINFTLLSEPGVPVLDCIVSGDKIKTAIDMARDILGC